MTINYLENVIQMDGFDYIPEEIPISHKYILADSVSCSSIMPHQDSYEHNNNDVPKMDVTLVDPQPYKNAPNIPYPPEIALDINLFFCDGCLYLKYDGKYFIQENCKSGGGKRLAKGGY